MCMRVCKGGCAYAQQHPLAWPGLLLKLQQALHGAWTGRRMVAASDGAVHACAGAGAQVFVYAPMMGACGPL